LESYVVYLICRAILGLLSVLPRALAGALVDLLATGLFWLDRRHRQIADTNLTIAFPALSRADRLRIARSSFCSVGRNALEVSRMARLTPRTIERLVTYDEHCGLNNFQAAVATGKPLLYLTGHFSAWELLPTAHALYGHPLSFITRPLDNPHLEKYIVHVREAAGNRVIAKKNSARQILENLKAGLPVGILMDQNTSLQEGVFANFFGIPAATSSGLALLALRRDAVVLPGYITPVRRGRYTIKFLPPLEMVKTGDMARDVQRNTERFNAVLEGIVKEQPASWLWGHKRWKLRPAEEGPRDLYAMSAEELRRQLASLRGTPGDAGVTASAPAPVR
jgi:Kdo2-lipid IVA lauroyltransferase/acyltransferase